MSTEDGDDITGEEMQLLEALMKKANKDEVSRIFSSIKFNKIALYTNSTPGKTSNTTSNTSSTNNNNNISNINSVDNVEPGERVKVKISDADNNIKDFEIDLNWTGN